MACHTDGVFTLAASQFKYYRVVVAEHFGVPATFQRALFSLQSTERELIDPVQLLHLTEFFQFVLSHTIFIIAAKIPKKMEICKK